jgi:SAM-dependent methyltransferase
MTEVDPARHLRANYEEIAARYDEERGGWERPVDDVVSDLLSRGPASLVALDLGCGTGRYVAAQPTTEAVRWIGIDPSSEMLCRARANAPGALLIRGQAEVIPCRANSLDYVYCSLAYHHFGDKQSAFHEIARVLRPGGRFRIDGNDPWTGPRSWVEEYFPGVRRILEAQHLPLPRLIGMLETIGFDVDAQVGPLRWSIPASEALAAAERRVFSGLAMLDDAAYSDGLGRLRRDVDAHAHALLECGSSFLRVDATKRSHSTS